MQTYATALAPWLLVAGLGAFHGANPAMGWLFAVALGLNGGGRRAVLLALAPLALGHMAAVALAAGAAVLLGMALEPRVLRWVAGAILLGWALWHVLRRHKGRVRFGMRASLASLALWSFLMAGAHGAGLMLVPALMPLCLGALAAGGMGGVEALLVTGVAIGVHTLSMLAVTGALALAVYDWLGVGILKQAWVNLDLVWTAALALCAGLLVVW
jgi:hypothetical protein